MVYEGKEWTKEAILNSDKFTERQKQHVQDEEHDIIYYVDDNFNINCFACTTSFNCMGSSHLHSCINVINSRMCDSCRDSEHIEFCSCCTNCSNCKFCNACMNSSLCHYSYILQDCKNSDFASCCTNCQLDRKEPFFMDLKNISIQLTERHI